MQNVLTNNQIQIKQNGKMKEKRDSVLNTEFPTCLFSSFSEKNLCDSFKYYILQNENMKLTINQLGFLLIFHL